MERGAAVRSGRVGELTEIVNAPELAAPVGFSHAVVADRTVYLGGQIAATPDGAVVGDTIAEQFDLAAANLMTALRAAGGGPDDLVALQVFVTSWPSTKPRCPSSGASGAGTSAAAIRRWACSA